jgi:all-trans-retinol dehydrogenase (NAD+)
MSLAQSIRVNKPPTILSTILSGLTQAASEPLVTGGLLCLLTRGSTQLRAQLLAPFGFTSSLFANDPESIARLAAVVTALKVLTTAGVLRRINEALNRLAWNNWTFKRSGAEWQFGPEKKEVILITGASSGFGYLMAMELSKHARIIALNRSPLPADLEALPNVHFYQCDVGDISALETVCEQVKKDFGTISVLINNAGYGIGKTLLEVRQSSINPDLCIKKADGKQTTNAEDERLFRVNLLSQMVLIRAFLPAMLAQEKGHVVSIASMASFVVPPNMVNYCISKIGALYLTEGLRAECLTRYPGGSSICNTSIHPGWHKTGIDKDGILAKLGIVEDPSEPVIDAVVDQVLNGKSGMICIPKHHQRDSLLRFWPRWAQDLKFGLVGSKV